MVTAKQMAALKYMIFNARNGTDLSKRILAALIAGSEGLTRNVCATLTTGCEGYTAEELQAAALGVSSMQSAGGTTHLDQLVHLMGSRLVFTHHYGDFDPLREGDPFSSAGQFAGFSAAQVTKPELVQEGMPLRYTFWLANEPYSRRATLLVVSREALDQINLKRPGLYSHEHD